MTLEESFEVLQLQVYHILNPHALVEHKHDESSHSIPSQQSVEPPIR